MKTYRLWYRSPYKECMMKVVDITANSLQSAECSAKPHMFFITDWPKINNGDSLEWVNPHNPEELYAITELYQ